VIGFLRFIGVINAAVWLGTAVFFTFGAGPACFSADMKTALGITAENSYFPGAIAQVILSRYFHVTLACGVVALLHLLAEWLYMGRPARKFSLALVFGLFLFTFIGGNVFQPELKKLHARHYSTQLSAAEREAAGKTFRVWHGVSQVFNLFMLGGLIVYAWRVGNPPDTLRFVSPVQFRG
jgi:hypothetical protein